jgi:calcineurin-like phosphoesterase family protein
MPPWLRSWRPLTSKTWFTADLTVTETTIKNWNDKVSHDDIVWLLGEHDGPVGHLNGRKYFIKGMRTARVPLLGGPVFGRPVVIVAARPDSPLGGRADWLVHGGTGGGELVDPELRRINVIAREWGGLPVGADEVAALVTGVDCDAVPDISQWKTLHS